jgi:hypothetical protein
MAAGGFRAAAAFGDGVFVAAFFCLAPAPDFRVDFLDAAGAGLSFPDDFLTVVVAGGFSAGGPCDFVAAAGAERMPARTMTAAVSGST